MAIKEWLKQTTDDIDGRLRNPLILSFILVWIYTHWELIYMIFLFEESITFPYKIMFIKLYLIEQGFSGLIMYPIFISMASLAVFYILGVIGSAIKIYFGKRLNAFALHNADKGNFETKEVTNKLKDENKELKRDIYKLDEEISEFKKKNKNLDIQLEKAVDEFVEMKENYESIKESETKKSVQVAKLIADNDNLKERVESETGLAALNVQRGNELKKFEDDLKNIQNRLDDVAKKNPIKFDSNILEEFILNGAIYDVHLNGVLRESITYNSIEKKMYSSKGYVISIHDVTISKSQELIMFKKSVNGSGKIENILIKVNNNLVGKEGIGDIIYTKSDRKVL